MRLFNSFANAVTGLSLFACAVHASSKAREPLNYLTTVENPQINTPSRRVNAYSTFDLTFDLHRPSEQIRLKLEPNHDILHEDAQVTFLGPDGTVSRTEKIVREDHKVFQGHAFTIDENGHSIPAGWARIMVLRDGKQPLFEGAFAIMGNTHHIQLRSNYMATKHYLDPMMEENGDEYMAVWRDTDVSRPTQSELRKRIAEPGCASDRLPFNSDLNHPIYRDLLKRSENSWGVASLDQMLGRRQSVDGGGAGNGNSAGTNLRQSVGSTTGCPKQRQVALIGIATDCSYNTDFGNNATALRENVISVVNTASNLYQSSFNITLGLRNLTVQDRPCDSSSGVATPWNVACSDSVNMAQRLNLFSAWRAQQGDSNAYWSLFTKCNTNSEVGLAWLGQLCNHGGTNQVADGQTQTVTGANVVARRGSEWQVFAHETGHTFGAVHDCDENACSTSEAADTSQCCPLNANTCNADAQYLMNPYSSPEINTFSPCTIGNICSALGRNSVSSSCLTNNKDVVTITGDVCGNGIVEGDEECDCGGDSGCNGNTCCNPRTCKFTTGSVCDPSNEGCCTQQCRFASAGSVCRESTSVCDPEETCPGTSGACPDDKVADDGTGCGNGLKCASGQCTSRDQQCRNVMGSYTNGNETYACNSQGCTISCGSPEFGSPGQRVCMQMNQNFLDGTPCGGNGHCTNGVCQGSNVGGQIKSWIDDNRTLVIALASVLGGLLVLFIVCCVFSCCRRRRRRTKTPAPAAPRYQQPSNMGQYNSPGAPAGYHPYANQPRQQSVRYA